MASLAKQLDKTLPAHKDQKLSAVINFIGEPSDEYLKKAKAFAEENGLKNVVVTVTGDADKFNVSDDAEITVMNYKRKRVKFNYAVDKDGFDDKAVQHILSGVKTILQ